MANKPKEGLQTIHIRVESELKDRLLAVVEKYNKVNPDYQITQADIIRAGLTKEINAIEQKIKKQSK